MTYSGVWLVPSPEIIRREGFSSRVAPREVLAKRNSSRIIECGGRGWEQGGRDPAARSKGKEGAPTTESVALSPLAASPSADPELLARAADSLHDDDDLILLTTTISDDHPRISCLRWPRGRGVGWCAWSGLSVQGAFLSEVCLGAGVCGGRKTHGADGGAIITRLATCVRSGLLVEDDVQVFVEGHRSSTGLFVEPTDR